MLDVLMYILENFAEDDVELRDNRAWMSSELEAAGFHSGEIDNAFDWLESLVDRTWDPAIQPVNPAALRLFSAQEELLLSLEARGFLLSLGRTGLLDQASLEDIIDRALALEVTHVDLERIKWVALMVLFNRPGREKLTSTIEFLVAQEPPLTMH